MFYRVANVLVRLMLRLLTRMEVVGRENIPVSGPWILVANHTHLIDPPLLAAVLPRPVVYMAKEEVFRSPVLGVIVRAYGAFPVRRGQPDRQALRTAEATLGAGLGLGMFPEGTRSLTGGLRRAFPGAALIASRSNAPVVPVGIDGSDRIFPDLLRGRRTRLRFVIGQPLAPRVSDRRANLDDATATMMRAIAAVLPPARRGVYAEAPRTIVESST